MIMNKQMIKPIINRKNMNKRDLNYTTDNTHVISTIKYF